MNNVIEARGLTKRYNGTVAVNKIDLEIPAGKIVGLIGPNGAGKTSALKAILGLATYEGELSVMGMDPAKDRAALMEEVCFIADVAVLPRWIRVWQLIELTEKIFALPVINKNHDGSQSQTIIQGYGCATALGDSYVN